MSGGFAGSMRERVELLRRTPGTDALGCAGGDWTVMALVWATCRPIGHGPLSEGGAASARPLWRVTMRPCDVRVGDRIDRVSQSVEVREVIADPALPDRVVAIGEQVR